MKFKFNHFSKIEPNLFIGKMKYLYTQFSNYRLYLNYNISSEKGKSWETVRRKAKGLTCM